LSVCRSCLTSDQNHLSFDKIAPQLIPNLQEVTHQTNVKENPSATLSLSNDDHPVDSVNYKTKHHKLKSTQKLESNQKET
jgi:hypothetical protein